MASIEDERLARCLMPSPATPRPSNRPRRSQFNFLHTLDFWREQAEPFPGQGSSDHKSGVTELVSQSLAGPKPASGTEVQQVVLSRPTFRQSEESCGRQWSNGGRSGAGARDGGEADRQDSSITDQGPRDAEAVAEVEPSPDFLRWLYVDPTRRDDPCPAASDCSVSGTDRREENSAAEVSQAPGDVIDPSSTDVTDTQERQPRLTSHDDDGGTLRLQGASPVRKEDQQLLKPARVEAEEDGTSQGRTLPRSGTDGRDSSDGTLPDKRRAESQAGFVNFNPNTSAVTRAYVMKKGDDVSPACDGGKERIAETGILSQGRDADTTRRRSRQKHVVFQLGWTDDGTAGSGRDPHQGPDLPRVADSRTHRSGVRLETKNRSWRPQNRSESDPSDSRTEPERQEGGGSEGYTKRRRVSLEHPGQLNFQPIYVVGAARLSAELEDDEEAEVDGSDPPLPRRHRRAVSALAEANNNAATSSSEESDQPSFSDGASRQVTVKAARSKKHRVKVSTTRLKRSQSREEDRNKRSSGSLRRAFPGARLGGRLSQGETYGEGGRYSIVARTKKTICQLDSSGSEEEHPRPFRGVHCMSQELRVDHMVSTPSILTLEQQAAAERKLEEYLKSCGDARTAEKPQTLTETPESYADSDDSVHSASHPRGTVVGAAVEGGGGEEDTSGGTGTGSQEEGDSPHSARRCASDAKGSWGAGTPREESVYATPLRFRRQPRHTLSSSLSSSQPSPVVRFSTPPATLKSCLRKPRRSEEDCSREVRHPGVAEEKPPSQTPREKWRVGFPPDTAAKDYADVTATLTPIPRRRRKPSRQDDVSLHRAPRATFAARDVQSTGTPSSSARSWDQNDREMVLVPSPKMRRTSQRSQHSQEELDEEQGLSSNAAQGGSPEQSQTTWSPHSQHGEASSLQDARASQHPQDSTSPQMQDPPASCPQQTPGRGASHSPAEGVAGRSQSLPAPDRRSVQEERVMKRRAALAQLAERQHQFEEWYHSGDRRFCTGRAARSPAAASRKMVPVVTPRQPGCDVEWETRQHGEDYTEEDVQSPMENGSGNGGLEVNNQASRDGSCQTSVAGQRRRRTSGSGPPTTRVQVKGQPSDRDFKHDEDVQAPDCRDRHGDDGGAWSWHGDGDLPEQGWGARERGRRVDSGGRTPANVCQPAAASQTPDPCQPSPQTLGLRGRVEKIRRLFGETTSSGRLTSRAGDEDSDLQQVQTPAPTRQAVEALEGRGQGQQSERRRGRVRWVCQHPEGDSSSRADWSLQQGHVVRETEDSVPGHTSQQRPEVPCSRRDAESGSRSRSGRRGRWHRQGQVWVQECSPSPHGPSPHGPSPHGLSPHGPSPHDPSPHSLSTYSPSPQSPVQAAGKKARPCSHSPRRRAEEAVAMTTCRRAQSLELCSASPTAHVPSPGSPSPLPQTDLTRRLQSPDSGLTMTSMGSEGSGTSPGKVSQGSSMEEAGGRSPGSGFLSAQSESSLGLGSPGSFQLSPSDPWPPCHRNSLQQTAFLDSHTSLPSPSRGQRAIGQEGKGRGRAYSQGQGHTGQPRPKSRRPCSAGANKVSRGRDIPSPRRSVLLKKSQSWSHHHPPPTQRMMTSLGPRGRAGRQKTAQSQTASQAPLPREPLPLVPLPHGPIQHRPPAFGRRWRRKAAWRS